MWFLHWLLRVVEQALWPGLALCGASHVAVWEEQRTQSWGRESVVNRQVPRSQENGYRVMMVLGMGEPKRPKLRMDHEPTTRVDVENKGASDHAWCMVLK